MKVTNTATYHDLFRRLFGEIFFSFVGKVFCASCFNLQICIYLVVCEISHQPNLNIGVVGDTTQDLGTLEGSLWVGAAVVKIPAGDKQDSPISYSHSETINLSKSMIT